MIADRGLLLLILSMAAVTYAVRWLPLLFFSRKVLPGWLTDWLDLIPVAVLGALVAPSLVMNGTPRHLDLTKPELLVAIPTFLFALRTRSLGGTVLVGMALFWAAGRWWA